MFYKTHERVQFQSLKPSLTKQSFKKECDINVIMKKFEKTGLVSHFNAQQGQYGNFIGAPDYHAAMNLLVAADEMFQSLPSKIRARFHNDPAEFLDFAQDEANEAEMIKLGLKRSEKPADPSTGQAGDPPSPTYEEAASASPAAPGGA